MKLAAPSLIFAAAFFVLGCTLHHSKQALSVGSAGPAGSDAVFVSEEDSGLMLGGLFVLSEPDHYAVLLERARRRYRCARMHHAQLDFFTDHWILVAFPIARLTLLCEKARVPVSEPQAHSTPAEPE